MKYGRKKNERERDEMRHDKPGAWSLVQEFYKIQEHVSECELGRMCDLAGVGWLSKAEGVNIYL